jgi:hypothetical protein
VTRQIAAQIGMHNTFREAPRTIDASEAIVVATGEDRTQGTGRHGLEHDERAVRRRRLAAGIALDLDVPEHVHRSRHTTLVEQDGLVHATHRVTADERRAAAGRTELTIGEQIGNAVEITRVEALRVRDDQRSDRFLVVGVSARAHGVTTARAQARWPPG